MLNKNVLALIKSLYQPYNRMQINHEFIGDHELDSVYDI